MNPWMTILDSLNLSRTEQEVAKRFSADIDGRTFLPVADILRSYRYFDESLELLTRGVMLHQNFTVARIVLVRELFQKGLVVEAWDTLEKSKSSLRDNVLAQKLRFKISLLLGYESIAKSTYGHMQRHKMLDPDTQRLGELYELSGLVNVRERMIKEIESAGVHLDLPARPGLGKLNSYEGQGERDNFESGQDPSDDYVQGVADGIGLQDSSSIGGGFQVVSLEEVFHGEGERQLSGGGTGGIELDSTTLADIYENQGHFEKALGVYRRLSRMTPSNEFLRSKIRDLATKSRDQKHDDLSIDPGVADSMEKMEVINRQIRFFEDVLSRLN